MFIQRDDSESSHSIEIHLDIEPSSLKPQTNNPMDLSMLLNRPSSPVKEETSQYERSFSERSFSVSTTGPPTPCWSPQPAYRLPPITSPQQHHQQLPPCTVLPALNSREVSLSSYNAPKPTTLPPMQLAPQHSHSDTRARSPLSRASSRRSSLQNPSWVIPVHSFSKTNSHHHHHQRPQALVTNEHRYDTSVLDEHHLRRPYTDPHSHTHSHSHLHSHRAPHSPVLIPTVPKPPHSNKAYSEEQVDWIRYNREDLKVSFKADLERYQNWFDDSRLTEQCLSSRYYRDNRVPLVRKVYHNDNEIWKVLFGNDGKARWRKAKVRERATPEGREADIPTTLVEKHPMRALGYSWVSEEHKEMARRILREDARNERRKARGERVVESQKAKWRRVILIAEGKLDA